MTDTTTTIGTTIDTTIDTTIGAEHILGDEAPTRRCGRCILRFPIPADTHPMELRDWWICPNCSEALLPGRQRTPTPQVEQSRRPT